MEPEPSSDVPGPVLVVEDHADTRHMVEEFLQFQGIPTVGAENGLAGLGALRDHRPSLVLLDLTMPVMDGWRFRQEQQQLAEVTLAQVPVVILSALSDCEDHARRLGALDVIPKPIDLDRLSALVRRFMGTAAGRIRH
jgi:DNA-binding response OmpR family regulator